MWKRFILVVIAAFFCIPETSFAVSASSATVDDFEAFPPFLTTGAPPLVMLVMGRNHKLYYEAYNDASDLNEDSILDVGYKPSSIDYYGYFDSYKCYSYVAANNRFEPTVVTADKMCSGATEWSGDFLNYVTMSRMDTIRKVLYGGLRSTDTSSATVLQRSYIPQDAHSWGKEYNPSIDSYDISDYTPLSTPLGDTRHIFVNTTLTSETSPPLLRVLENSVYRVWDWVACEVPVAGSRVINGSTGPLVTDNGVISSSTDETNGGTAGTATDIGNNPAAETIVKLFDDDVNSKWLTFTSPPVWVKFQFNTPKQILKYSLTTANDVKERDPKTWTLQASNDNSTWVTVDTVADGMLSDTRFQRKEFTCSSPPAIPYTYYKLVITDLKSSGSYCGSNRCSQIAEMELIENVGASLTPANATLTDYEVRVEVCDASMLERNCDLYPDGNYKPTGLLQRHGETNRMYFGLMSGSYTHNTKGGVLRKNIGSIQDEINVNSDGTFNSATNGIIQTINKFRIDDFDYGSKSYNSSCGWITTRAINDGECRMWGNPIGEIMYEGLRYFAGESSPTAAFDYTYSPTDNTLDDNELRLPKPDWIDPYTLEDVDGDGVIDAGEDLNSNSQLDGFSSCSKPFMLVISDINPTFDSDDLPGANSNFGSLAAAAIGNAATSLDVETLSDIIGLEEGVAGDHYIGQQGSTVDGACTAKTVSGLGDIRGLCPEEPTKKGSYYSAAVAYYGKKEDLHAADGDQKVTTYSVGLASPLPRIEIPVAGKIITLVPFAKSIAGSGINGAAGQFQPTNTIVDFFVETMDLVNGYGKFRINYEDVEQGADHDMDFVAIYEYQLVDILGDPVLATDPNAAGIQITVTNDYAAGGITQIAGYIISGTIAGTIETSLGTVSTTGDGIYLEVRDENASAPAYYLDTPPGVGPGQSASGVHPLPLTNSRYFIPNPNPAAVAATLLENPLYYAAKWGGFEDEDGDLLPNLSSEWDENVDGTPDTYFYVVNPLRLEEQLNRSFASILQRTSSGTAASVISSSRSGEGAIYQAVFFPGRVDDVGREINWAGDVHSLWLDSSGNIREDCGDPSCIDPCGDSADCPSDHILDLETDYIVTFYTDSLGVARARRYRDAVVDGEAGDGKLNSKACSNSSYTTEDECTGAGATWDYSFSPNFVADNIDLQNLRYLWSGGNWLAGADPTTQRTYRDVASDRYIITWLGTGDSVPFTPVDLKSALTLDLNKYKGYLNAANETEADTIVNYIRGQDQTGYRSRLIDWDDDGTTETYKLGDIIYSTPTIVTRPAEDYDVIYNDDSYRQFRKYYQNRRTMVYAGGNDGGLHAFNGGHYDRTYKKFYPGLPIAGTDPVEYETTEFDLGAEMWMFIPFNLLPHLKWLTDPNYDADKHVYYVDLKPKVFDAKIFDPDDGIHIGGWGTILVGGMRLGGGNIEVDTDDDGTDDETMSSAYFILDITNPECPPVILAEFADADFIDTDLGFTTSYPTAIPMLTCDIRESNSADLDFCGSDWPMNWYLAFGSGPHDSAVPGTAIEGRSDQKAGLYVLKLGGTDSSDYVYTTFPDPVPSGTCPTMITNRNPPSLVAGYPKEVAAICSDPGLSDETTCTDAGNTWEDFADSFFGDVISVDFDLSFQADTLYLGSVTHADDADPGDDQGGMHRLVIQGNDVDDPETWQISTMLNVGQPVNAAPAVSYDGQKFWLHFGTGRFFSSYDKGPSATQSFYGVKEQGINGDFDLTVPSDGDLVDVSDVWVENGSTLYGTLPLQSTGGNITSGGTKLTSPTLNLGVDNFTDLNNGMVGYDGWKIDFDVYGERSLGQATVLGNIVTFTTYVPSTDFCTAEGESYLWAPFYKTGTAYYRSVIGLVDDTSTGTEKEKVLRKISLGRGMSTTPNIYSGIGKEGTTAFVQTSTGAIIGIEQDNPGVVKSGPASWRELQGN